MKLVATKSFPYATRQLMAGDVFEAHTSDHARVLTLMGKAKPLDERPIGKLPAPPKSLMEKIAPKPESADDLAALRAEYAKLFGKRPFHGWGADVLRAKIAAVNG